MRLGVGLRRFIGVALIVTAGPAATQTNELVQMGRLATLGPLCGLRDEAWAFDLRRAELQGATGSKRWDDEALRAAPGSGAASAALGYAEMEAQEDFAEGPPEQACGKLAHEPGMGQADEIVRAFRAQRQPASGS
jgi:hypothetical protein